MFSLSLLITPVLLMQLTGNLKVVSFTSQPVMDATQLVVADVAPDGSLVHSKAAAHSHAHIKHTAHSQTHTQAMPWDATQMVVADVAPDGSLGASR